MPRTTRRSTQLARSISKSKPKTTRSSLKSRQDESSDEDDNGIPAVATPRRPGRPRKSGPPAQPAVTKSKRRGTRSNPTQGGFSELPSRKRQRRFLELQAHVPERRGFAKYFEDEDNHDALEGKHEGVNHDAKKNEVDEHNHDALEDKNEEDNSDAEEDRDEDEDLMTLGADFFKNINHSILPEGDVPQDNIEVTNNTKEQVSDQGGGDSNDAEQQLLVEQAEIEDTPIELVSRAPAPHMNQSQPNRRGKQRKKTAYGGVEEQAPRVKSPELGSDRPYSRESSPSQQEPEESTTTEDPPGNEWYSDDPDDGEGEPELGPEKSTLVAIEESLFIEAPQEADEHITTEVRTQCVVALVSKMGYIGWAGNKNWEDQFTVRHGQTKPAWFKQHDEFLKPQRCKALFRYLDRLRTLCHDIPKAPDFGGQSEYLRQQSDAIGKSVAHINALVSHICKSVNEQIALLAEQKPHRVKWGKTAVETIHKRIVPMLVLVLMEGFLAGGVVTISSGKTFVSAKGQFTTSTLDLPQRIMGWLQRLYEVVMAYAIVDPFQPVSDAKTNVLKTQLAKNQREKLRKSLRDVDEVLRQAVDKLDYNAHAPQRAKEAAERNLAFRIALEKKQQEEREAQDRQMQLFVGSIRRMQKPQPSETRSSQGEVIFVAQGEGELRNDQVHAEHRPDTAEEYFEKFGGWYKWEDERLLNMLRKVEKPDVRALVPLVPGRMVEEVAQRLTDLRERMRLKYEQAGIVPPLWCYELR